MNPKTPVKVVLKTELLKSVVHILLKNFFYKITVQSIKIYSSWNSYTTGPTPNDLLGIAVSPTPNALTSRISVPYFVWTLYGAQFHIKSLFWLVYRREFLSLLKGVVRYRNECT